MIVTMSEAMEIVRECELVATKKYNGYNGTVLCDLQPYAGRYGTGYSITQGKVRRYWCYPVNEISDAVYDGEYDISNACMTANNVCHIRYGSNGVLIVPSWQLDLNTVTGDNTLKITEESLKPMVLSGHTLTIMWRGSVRNDVLRNKIRRKFRLLLRSGNAKLVKNFEVNAQETEQNIGKQSIRKRGV